jgi:hypothetical protein
VTEEASSEKSSAGWKVFGQISAVIFVVCAVIGAVIGVATFSAGRPDVVARISFADFDTPPGFKIESTSDSSRTRLPVLFRGYSEISVYNSGGTQADDVVLDVPFEGVAHVRPDDSEARAVSVGSTIRLGVIRPNHHVLVRIWSGITPEIFDADDFGLTHSKGVGAIEVEMKSFGLADLFFAHIPGWIWFALFVICAGMLGMTVSNSVERLSKLERQNTSADPSK